MPKIHQNSQYSTHFQNAEHDSQGHALDPRQPRTTRGRDSLPPFNNMGGTENFDDGTETFRISSKKGRAQIVRIPSKVSGADKRVGFVDQVSFTVRCHQVLNRELVEPYDSSLLAFPPADALPRIASIIFFIFGFSVTAKRDRGLNFYSDSYFLGDGDGLLSIGGQNDTLNVQIYASGCSKAKQGWQERLKNYLHAVDGWITRVDIAADFFDGSYSVDQAEQDYLSGKMSLTNRTPFAERRGDWYSGKGGRTFYVGRRGSGKLLRVYEKGLQLIGTLAASQQVENSKLSNLLDWVRVEVEWHNQDRICPLDMLTEPGKYLAGSYPAFNHLNQLQDVVKTKKNTVLMTVEKAKEWLRHTAGRHLKTLSELFGSDEIIHFATSGKDHARYVYAFSPLPMDHQPFILRC